MPQLDQNAKPGEKATPDDTAQGPAQPPAPALSPSLAAVAQLPELQQPAALKQSMKARQSAQPRKLRRTGPRPRTPRCHSPIPAELQVLPFAPVPAVPRYPGAQEGKKSEDASSQDQAIASAKPRRVLGKAAGFAAGLEVARHSRGAGCLSGSGNGGFRAVQSLGAGFRRAYSRGPAEGRPARPPSMRARSILRHLRFADSGRNPRAVCGHGSDHSKRRSGNQAGNRAGRTQERRRPLYRQIRPPGSENRYGAAAV